MNYLAILRQCVAYVCFTLASFFVLSLTAFLLRRQLRVLLDRWRALGRLGQCVTLVFVTGFVLYGGSKNTPSSPPSGDDDDADSHLEPLLSPESVAQLSRMMETESAPSLQLSTANQIPQNPLCVTAPLREISAAGGFSTISRWGFRGAWEDWQRIEFPDGFAFPIGTNQITEVTVMSYGELRTSLTPTNSNIQTFPNSNILALPCRVSLEPGESTVSYGLTASNSFLVAWDNACVERSATNRVNASIELFRSGDTLVTIQPTTTNEPPTTIYTPAPLPEGFFGEGQDLAWATNAFPNSASNIVASGYTSWLENEFVGINMENGHYQVKLTIAELPEVGPCYLVCGPYKVVLKSPGTYCFPLEVFEEYTACTYPVSVPLTVEYDDGYRGPAATPSSGGASLLSAQLGQYGPLRIFMEPTVYISPCSVPLEQAEGTYLSIWCNISNAIRSWRSLSGMTYLMFFGSDAEIYEASVIDRVVINLQVDGHEVTGEVSVTGPEHPELCPFCQNDDCPCHGDCAPACFCHTLTNGLLRCSGELH